MNKENISLLERIAVLEQDADRMRDMEAIRDVLTRYSRALDWLDNTMLEGVIFDDAEIDYGFFKGKGKDFKPVLMEVERAVGRRWHFTAQIKIHLRGDEADVESYNLSLGSPDQSAGEGSEIMHFCGYYADRLEKRGGVWGITSRKHLLVSGATLKEVAMTGDFAALNQIGYADTEHGDFRKLGD